MKPNIMDRTAKIITEIMVRTYIDKIDIEGLEDILQAELTEYHNEVFTYAHDIGYDDGYSDGRSYGHSEV